MISDTHMIISRIHVLPISFDHIERALPQSTSPSVFDTDRLITHVSCCQHDDAMRHISISIYI